HQAWAFAVPHAEANDLGKVADEVDLTQLLLQSPGLVVARVHARQGARGAKLLDDDGQRAAIGTGLRKDVVQVPVDGHVAGPLAAHPIVRVQGVRVDWRLAVQPAGDGGV